MTISKRSEFFPRVGTDARANATNLSKTIFVNGELKNYQYRKQVTDNPVKLLREFISGNRNEIESDNLIGLNADSNGMVTIAYTIAPSEAEVERLKSRIATIYEKEKAKALAAENAQLLSNALVAKERLDEITALEATVKAAFEAGLDLEGSEAAEPPYSNPHCPQSRFDHISLTPNSQIVEEV